MRLICIVFTLFFSFLFIFLSTPARANDKAQLFFAEMKKHCGKVYQGTTHFPQDENHDFYGKTLVMQVKTCDKNQIRIPFSVGEDHSRTWILSWDENGLLFKHDHRLKDGSPDKVTLYGGYSDESGSQFRQSFPADSHTASLIPAAKTNVWRLTFEPQKKQFIYFLERAGQPRYKAIFDTTDKQRVNQ